MGCFNRFFIPAFFLLASLMTGCQQNRKQSNIRPFQSNVSQPGQLMLTNPSCRDDLMVDACIFWKNPVAHSGSPLENSADMTSVLQELQTYGVNFRETFTSSYQASAHASNTLANRSFDSSYANYSPRDSSSYGNQPFGFQPYTYNNSFIELTDEGFSFNNRSGLPQGLLPFNSSNRSARRNSYDSRSNNPFYNNAPAYGNNFGYGQNPNYRQNSNYGYNSSYDRGSYNRYGLPRSDEDSQGLFLENASYYVTINYGNAQRATPGENGWKFEYGHPDHPIAQIMAYYYLINQMEWMQENGGGWYAQNRNITVVALDEDLPNGALWSPYDNTIALGMLCQPRSSRFEPCVFRMEMALSAEAILHEAGHANFDHSAVKRLGMDGDCQNHRYKEGSSICDEVYRTDTEDRDIFCASEKGVLLCYFRRGC